MSYIRTIRSWVRRFLGYEELVGDIHGVWMTVDAVDQKLDALTDELIRRRDMESDAVARLKQLQQAVNEGAVDGDSNLISDLDIEDFDPQLGT